MGLWTEHGMEFMSLGIFFLQWAGPLDLETDELGLAFKLCIIRFVIV